MAEIGIAASIVGIAIAAAQIASALNDAYTKYESSEPEIRSTAIDVEVLSVLLTQIGKQFERNDAVYPPRVEMCARNLAQQCHDVCEEIKGVIQTMGKRRSAMFFKMNKLVRVQSKLEPLKTTLQLTMSLMVLTKDLQESSPISDRVEQRVSDVEKLMAQTIEMDKMRPEEDCEEPMAPSINTTEPDSPSEVSCLHEANRLLPASGQTNPSSSAIERYLKPSLSTAVSPCSSQSSLISRNPEHSGQMSQTVIDLMLSWAALRDQYQISRKTALLAYHGEHSPTNSSVPVTDNIIPRRNISLDSHAQEPMMPDQKKVPQPRSVSAGTVPALRLEIPDQDRTSVSPSSVSCDIELESPRSSSCSGHLQHLQPPPSSNGGSPISIADVPYNPSANMPRPQGSPRPQGAPQPQWIPQPPWALQPQWTPQPQWVPQPQWPPQPQWTIQPQWTPHPQWTQQPQWALQPQGTPHPQGALQPQEIVQPQGALQSQWIGVPRPQESVALQAQETPQQRGNTLQLQGTGTLQRQASPQPQVNRNLRRQETKTLQLQGTRSPQIPGTRALQLQETVALQPQETGALQVRDAGTLHSRGVEALQLQETGAPQLQETLRPQRTESLQRQETPYEPLQPPSSSGGKVPLSIAGDLNNPQTDMPQPQGTSIKWIWDIGTFITGISSLMPVPYRNERLDVTRTRIADNFCKAIRAGGGGTRWETRKKRSNLMIITQYIGPHIFHQSEAEWDYTITSGPAWTSLARYFTSREVLKKKNYDFKEDEECFHIFEELQYEDVEEITKRSLS